MRWYTTAVLPVGPALGSDDPLSLDAVSFGGKGFMKALRLETTGFLNLCEVPSPEPEAHQTRLRVVCSAVCRTDAKMWQEGQRDLVLPRILGHEVVVRDEATGRLCVVWPGEACGTCALCRGGRENLCRHMRILGFHRDGGFAEYLVAPRRALIPLPDGIPADVASLAEPLGCCVNALARAGLQPGERVIICGGGPVGLLMALAARDQGVRPFVVERERSRLEASEPFRRQAGIDAGLTPDPNPFDVAVNAAPSVGCFSEWIPRLRAGGRFCLFSAFPGGESVSTALLNAIHYRELGVVGAYGCTRDQMIQALGLIARNERALNRLIEARISLEGVPGAMRKILAGEAFKFVIVFDLG